MEQPTSPPDPAAPIGLKLMEDLVVNLAKVNANLEINRELFVGLRESLEDALSYLDAFDKTAEILGDVTDNGKKTITIKDVIGAFNAAREELDAESDEDDDEDGDVPVEDEVKIRR